MDRQTQLAVLSDNIIIPVPADGFVENSKHVDRFGE
jgi:hypothetical protein